MVFKIHILILKYINNFQTGISWRRHLGLCYYPSSLWRFVQVFTRRAHWPEVSAGQQQHLCGSGCQVGLPQILQGHLPAIVWGHREICGSTEGEGRWNWPQRWWGTCFFVFILFNNNKNLIFILMASRKYIVCDMFYYILE